MRRHTIGRSPTVSGTMPDGKMCCILNLRNSHNTYLSLWGPTVAAWPLRKDQQWLITPDAHSRGWANAGVGPLYISIVGLHTILAMGNIQCKCICDICLFCKRPNMCAQSYEISTDEYHGVQRLNLYQYDGSPMNPMYLVYSPTPQMLPTQTLNPTSSGAAATAGPTSASTNNRKRGLLEIVGEETPSFVLDPDVWWWSGIGMTACGALAYFAF